MINPEIQLYLIKVCEILNSHNVEYLVVGGAAVSYHGYNRKSGIGEYNAGLKVDLDFWYNPTTENFQNIIKALDDLNVDTTELKVLVFDPKRTFLKIPHKDFHTDFLPIMEGLESFRSSKERAQSIDIGGATVKVLSYDDLILNKRTVNRKTDRADIEELDKIRKSKGRGRGI